MSFEGTVHNGVVVFEPPAQLPDGTRVTITVNSPDPAAEELRDFLLHEAGCMQGLPSDLAAQHDHYLHGTPKR